MDAPPRALVGRAELQVLRLAAEGKTQLEIAQKLHYSYAYVRTLSTQAYEQLGAQNITQAVALAIRSGLL